MSTIKEIFVPPQNTRPLLALARANSAPQNNLVQGHSNIATGIIFRTCTFFFSQEHPRVYRAKQSKIIAHKYAVADILTTLCDWLWFRESNRTYPERLSFGASQEVQGVPISRCSCHPTVLCQTSLVAFHIHVFLIDSHNAMWRMSSAPKS